MADADVILLAEVKRRGYKGERPLLFVLQSKDQYAEQRSRSALGCILSDATYDGDWSNKPLCAGLHYKALFRFVKLDE